MDMRREVAQFILENDFVAEKQVFKRIVHKKILCLKVKSHMLNKKLQGYNFFSFRGTYSEYSYSIAVSMLEYILHENFDSLLKHYVFDPLDMVR